MIGLRCWISIGFPCSAGRAGQSVGPGKGRGWRDRVGGRPSAHKLTRQLLINESGSSQYGKLAGWAAADGRETGIHFQHKEVPGSVELGTGLACSVDALVRVT